MEKTYEMKEDIEKVILVGVNTQNADDTEDSLEELKELVKTAGGLAVGTVIQNREAAHPSTYIGKGKIEEVGILMEELGATGIVCDDEMSPSQLRNLENALQTKVMDRTQVILDIFARRASTREGKIQVELAQLKYRSSRLIGMRNALSRLGGGIGTRGPGEKKLEMDRRLIKERIGQLKDEIADMEKHRSVARSRRSENSVPVIAIVGYTNAGKSTLLNRLTKAGVLEEDKLFATLDPITRNLKLENGQEVLFTDTVGFIRKLPHHLIDAFRSTLEEAKYADMIVHVVDCSSPQMDKQMEVVYETLQDLGVEGKTIITLFNKQDLLEGDRALSDPKADFTLPASVKYGEGLEELLALIEKILRESRVFISGTFSYQDAAKIGRIRKYGELLKEEYLEEGIYIEALVPKELKNDIYG
ncbi:GTPase HflX [Parasporobacterium paucivorans]|uniref:GTPase HflX n=1 Tax=Parasporobacterium paucivorans DSM 15970 TaxID=1122934 RepID=A0A1M6C9V9_9FIRM|nr:GTPase HflX [Parasporobacterium paucivorans]SHI57571.1 GTP-binding protein HflX [Parasporobacterium paucivorans DSM 15970]